MREAPSSAVAFDQTIGMRRFRAPEPSYSQVARVAGRSRSYSFLTTA
jgi:hypothetical protein